MSDQIQSLSGLLSAMPVNTVGGISAQDIRNALYSALGVLPYAAKNTDYTLTDNDGFITMDATAGARAVTVPQATTVRAGKIYVVMRLNSGANAVTIQRSGSDTINGATSKSLSSQYAGLLLLNTGNTTNWWAFALTGA